MNLADQAIAAYQQLVANQAREAEVRAADEVATITKACKREFTRLFGDRTVDITLVEGRCYAVSDGLVFVYIPHRDSLLSGWLHLVLGKCDKCGEEVSPTPVHNLEDVGRLLLNPDIANYHFCEANRIPQGQFAEPEPPSVEQLLIQSLTMLIQQVINGG